MPTKLEPYVAPERRFMCGSMPMARFASRPRNELPSLTFIESRLLSLWISFQTRSAVSTLRTNGAKTQAFLWVQVAVMTSVPSMECDLRCDCVCDCTEVDI